MIAAVLGSIAAYLAGSLLWRLAALMVCAALVIWCVRRLAGRSGDEQPSVVRDTALLVPILALGIWAGWQHGGAERAGLRAQAKASAAALEQAEEDKVHLRQRAESIERRAQAEATAAAQSYQRLAADLAAVQRRTAQIHRRSSHVSRAPDGSIARVPDEWVRDYNAALGIADRGVLPAAAGSAGASGSRSDRSDAADARLRGQRSGAAGAAGATGESDPAAQPDAPGFLAPVNISDVLSNHADNAAGCAGNSARLAELQRWYIELRAQRNGQAP